MFYIIAAVDVNNGIGKNNRLPWPRHKEDMQMFRDLTTGQVVIMGRKTYESIGHQLPNRTNLIVGRNHLTLSQAIRMGADSDKNVFIIGGGQIFEQTINIADKMILTRFHQRYDCDTFFPQIDARIWRRVSSTPMKDVSVERWERW